MKLYNKDLARVIGRVGLSGLSCVWEVWLLEQTLAGRGSPTCFQSLCALIASLMLPHGQCTIIEHMIYSRAQYRSIRIRLYLLPDTNTAVFGQNLRHISNIRLVVPPNSYSNSSRYAAR